MHTDKTVFITGATGLVGGLLALRALAAGLQLRLLVRGCVDLATEERIRRVFSFLGMPEEEWGVVRDRVEIVPGDVTQRRFGLTTQAWQQAAKNLQAVFHAAAYTGFDRSQVEKSVAVNLDGTRNVLNFVEQARTARYFHISTAYIVGDSRERVFEEPQNGSFPWKNPYEKTKCLAEQEVHGYCRQKSLNATVFRPAILIGDSRSGRTLRFNNIYNFIRVAHALSRRRSRQPVIIEAKAAARLNIVPVDFAADTIWHISQLAESGGKIFHITNPSPPSFVELVEAYSRILDLNIQCVDPSDQNSTGILGKGRRIGAAFSEYGEYMFGEPEFDLSQSRSLFADYDARFPSLNEEYYRKILDFAVAENWGHRQQALPTIVPKTSKSSYAEKYFKEFLPAKLHQQLLINLKNLNGIVAIHFRDQAGPDWMLELRDGMLTAISQKSQVPECTYDTALATFETVARGLARPEQVFFDGDADIQGDIEKGLQVITALSEFFRSYPFNPGEERAVPRQ